ncbi:MAG: TldD/PmbA family protein [Candidatus Muiribacteriota bacterium]
MSYNQRKSQLKEKADFILERAKKYAPCVFITLTDGANALTRFGENEITQNVSTQLFSADIMLACDNKSTKLQIDSMDEKKLDKMLKSAVEILKYQKEDEFFPEFPEKIDFEEKSDFDDKTAFMTPDERAGYAINAINKAQQNNLDCSGIVKNGYNTAAIASSNGLFAYAENTYAEISVTVMDDKGFSGWAEASAGAASKIDFDNIANTAVSKALLSKNPQDIEPGEYDVILEPAACADFLMFLSYMGFSTEGYYEGENPFKNKIGQKVLSEKITIVDNAYNELYPGLPFDFEGNRREKLTPIENGVFKELPIDYKWGKKLNKKSTGHGLPYPNSHGPFCLNLQIIPGTRKLEDIIKESDNALLVTHFHYTNIINPNDLTITGMTRDGLYMIKDGKISHPVKNMRFTESIIKALNNVDEVSSEQVFHAGFFGGGSILTGMKIKNFKFTSKTDY